MEVPEDQQQFILPINRETEQLYYDTRLIIDNNVLVNPRAWKISKINRIASNGVIVFTCAQDKYNPNADYLDDNNYWWADYFDKDTGQPMVNNEVEPIDNVYGIITCLGSQNIKVHGSYKKLTISYYNGDKPIEPLQGSWHFLINGEDASSLIQVKTDNLQSNEIKVKFLGESNYIGKELNIRFIPLIGDTVNFNIPVVSL